MNTKVFICSPFRSYNGGPDLARRMCKLAFDSGYAPFAPHLIYPDILNDSVSEEREMGIQAGFEYLRCCIEIWVYVDAIVSRGMRREIEYAVTSHTRIRWITDEMLEGKRNIFDERIMDE